MTPYRAKGGEFIKSSMQENCKMSEGWKIHLWRGNLQQLILRNSLGEQHMVLCSKWELERQWVILTAVHIEVLFKQESHRSEKSQKSYSLNHSSGKILINFLFFYYITVGVFSKYLAVAPCITVFLLCMTFNDLWFLF